MSNPEMKGLQRGIRPAIVDMAQTDKPHRPSFWGKVIHFERWPKRKTRIAAEIIEYLKVNSQAGQILIEQLARAKTGNLCREELEREFQSEIDLAALCDLDPEAADALLSACRQALSTNPTRTP